VSPAERAEVGAWARQTRREQGLPELVTDPAVLARVAQIIRAAAAREAEERDAPAA
jgi:hypothetical protein